VEAVKFPHLIELDRIIKFYEDNPGYPMTLKPLYALRVQAFIDLEPLMKDAPIPSVEELDA
jgi:hypothetical protein